MQLFGAFKDDAIVAQGEIVAGLEGPPGAERDTGLQWLSERGTTLTTEEIQDQFIVFQFSSSDQGPSVLESSQVEPRLQGSDEKPDALARLQLTTFHVGKEERIEKDTRATLRLDLSKDRNSSSSLDTLYWAVAAGLSLYDEIKKGPAESRDLRADFSEAFAQRPIEIPGSLARFSFEVVKHREPAWWQRIFSFLGSETGKTLISAVGFPGVTGRAVELVDELLNRLNDDRPEVLFRSRPMTLALTTRARDELTGGLPGIRPGVLNPGYCLMARGRDFSRIVGLNPRFLIAYGKLVPGDLNPEEFLSGNFENPFDEMTYAVFRVGLAETRLQHNISFGF